MWIILTLAAAGAAGLLLLKLKVPGGMLVGAILGAAALNLLTDKAYIYPQARVVAQSLTGAYIGCMMTREDVRLLPKVIKPYLIMMASFLALNLCVGGIFCRITDFDLLTCLLCAAPGGITDIPLIALDMGANSPVVAVMQLTRMIFGVACLPSIIILSDRVLEPEAPPQAGGQAGHSPQRKTAGQISLRNFFPAFWAALAAGALGKLSGIPAGAMTAAVIVTCVLKVTGRVNGMPKWLRRVAQAVSGCCIGTGITMEQVRQMGQLILPAVILCLGYILFCIAMGVVVSKCCRMPLLEAMLTLAPAGASEMALIAADMGIESARLAVLQICRLLGVSVIFPQIHSLIVSFVE